MNKMRHGVLWCCLLMAAGWFIPQLARAQPTRYVKPGGTGAGTSWSDAMGDIQAAINVATSGDRVFIAKGQYTPSATLDITKAIKVYGGFDGTETHQDQRNRSLLHTTNATKIIGKLTQAAVYIHPTADADQVIIDGLSISGAGRSAVFIERGDNIITWCNFENNRSVNGGAIYVSSGQADVSNCVFNQNRAGEDAFHAINYPFPSHWNLVNYRLNQSTDGWINGVNKYLDKEKAMYFDISSRADRYVNQIYIAFGHANSTNPAKTVPIKIYDGTTGKPGQLLGTSTLTMADIMSAIAQNQFSLVLFAQPIQLPASKKFFVSVDLSNLEWNTQVKDVLSIISNTHGQTNPSLIWEKQADNSWVRYSTGNSYEIDASLLIHPFVSDVPFASGITEVGGAIYQSVTGSFKVRNCVFGNNNAVFGGALFNHALSNTTGNAEITNNSFYQNSATSTGGAIYDYGYAGSVFPVISNNIVWDNTAATGNDIHDNGTNAAQAKSNITQGYQTGGGFNWSIDPLFADPANGDVTVQASSPAIDAGSRNLYDGLNANSKDLAGNDRVYLYGTGGLLDIGAYEAAISKPIITTSIGATTFTEGNNTVSTPVLIDPSLTLLDLDNSTLASATLRITNGFITTEDELIFESDGSTMGNIEGNYNAVNGELILTSTGAVATSAEWTTALRAVTYSNNSELPNITPRSITFVINDGVVNSHPSTKVINIVSVNDTPIVKVPADIQPVYQNQILEFNAVNGNAILVSDVDAGMQAVKMHLVASNGLITLSGIGGLVFTVGDGSEDSELIFEGAIAAINAALDGLSFTSTVGFIGQASIWLKIDDKSATGPGVPETDEATITIDVQTVSQKITFNALSPQVYGNDPLTLNALASSGLPVTYTSSDPSVAKIIGDKVYLIAVGNVVITAAQAGNGLFEPAVSVNQALIVKPAELRISARSGQEKIYGSDEPELTYSVTGFVSGEGVGVLSGLLEREPGEDVGTYAINQGSLTVGPNYFINYTGANFRIAPKAFIGITLLDGSFEYDGTAKHLTVEGMPDGTTVNYINNSRIDVGVEEVTAIVEGKNYETLKLHATLKVLPAERVLTFPTLPIKQYGNSDFPAGALVNSKETITYTSSNLSVAVISESGVISIVGAGEAIIEATVPPNPNYRNNPTISHNLIVKKANQKIIANIPGEVKRNAGTIQLDVTVNSNLPLSLVVDDEQVANLEGMALKVLRLGTVKVTATQPGDENHEAATPVTVMIRVIDPAYTSGIRVHPAISPNGDGINEFLMIEGIRDFPENQVSIFDSKGVLVWETSGYNNELVVFRGVGSGQKKLVAGTYFYMVEISTENGVDYKKGYFVLRY